MRPHRCDLTAALEPYRRKGETPLACLQRILRRHEHEVTNMLVSGAIGFGIGALLTGPEEKPKQPLQVYRLPKVKQCQSRALNG